MIRGCRINMKSLSKQQIRKYIKSIKSEMTESEILIKSRSIENKLMETMEYKEASSIYVFISYNQEVLTSGIIEKSLKDGKKVYVPKIYGDVIRFHEIHSLEADVSPGAFGILEPLGGPADESHEGLMIMPGVAFDRELHRLGYGGGYYDKYLAIPNSHLKMAVAYEFQILDSIPTDEFDVKMDIIITENEIIRK